MTRHRLAAALTTACGLGAAAAGWLICSPPTHLGDAGALPAHRAVTDGRARASPPTRIHGPAGLDAAVVPVAARANGALRLPEDPRTGGWWALGAPVGAPAGTALIAGHVDTADEGPGPFAALHDMRLGARVAVTGADAEVRLYRVVARRTYRQHELPSGLFTRAGPHRLALVTCAGAYDRAEGRYERNLVLYATPVDAPGRSGARPGLSPP